MCTQVFAFGRLSDFYTAVRAGSPDEVLMETFALTNQEVTALKAPGVSVDSVRRGLVCEHNDVANAHEQMTMVERMRMARETINTFVAEEALKEYERKLTSQQCEKPVPEMPEFPTDITQLHPNARASVAEQLGLAKSQLQARMQLVLLPEGAFTQLMGLYSDLTNEARKKQQQPKLRLKQIEAMVGALGPAGLVRFLVKVNAGQIKLSEAGSYTKKTLAKSRKCVFFLVIRFLCFSTGLDPPVDTDYHRWCHSTSGFGLPSMVSFHQWVRSNSELCVCVGLLENFVFFANWNPKLDNTPPAEEAKESKGKRKSNRLKKKKKVAHLPGGPFFNKQLKWSKLCREFERLVYKEKLDSLFEQLGDTKPLQMPTKGVRVDNSLRARQNVAALCSNFENLPAALRRWITQVQEAIGHKYEVAGYEAAPADVEESLPPFTCHYAGNNERTDHFFMTGDVTTDALWDSIEKLPVVPGGFRACHVQLDQDFVMAKLSAFFTRMLGLAAPHFVALVQLIDFRSFF